MIFTEINLKSILKDFSDFLLLICMFVININLLQMDLNYPRPGHRPIPSTFKFPNTAYAPPNIPPGYGTSLYPAENLDPDNLLAMELEEISRNRKSNDLIKRSADSKVKGLEIDKRKLEQEYSYSKKCKFTQVMR